MAIAPTTQVMITVQFASAMRALNALEIADLYASFSEAMPHYAELAPVGPMPYTLQQLDGSEPVPFEMPGMKRLSFASPTTNRAIYLQQDRFSYAWQRTVSLREQDDYPGFEAIYEEFESSFALFQRWTLEVLQLEVAATVGEVAYVNVFHTRTLDGQKVRLSDLYTFIRPSSSPVPVNGYQHTWNERLVVAEGVLTVTVAGPLKTPANEPASSFSLTNTFKLDDSVAMREQFLAVRERSGETYRRVVGIEE